MGSTFDTSLLLFLYPFLFIIQTVVAAHILLNKHEEPTSAILWLLLVFTLPVLGVVLYLFLGVNRMQTLGLRVRIASELSKIDRLSPFHDTIRQIQEHEKPFIDYKLQVEPHHYGRPFDRLLPFSRPLIGNKVDLLMDGTQAYPEMLEAIEKAGHTINLQSYIISNDVTGKRIMDALVKKAKNGVEVNVLYDRFGSFRSFLKMFFANYTKHKLKNLRIYPFVIGNVLVPWRIQLRNHRKLLIVDGTIAFIGGINISSENDLSHSSLNRCIHDLHCRIEGPAVADFQYAFLRDWFYVTRDDLPHLFSQKYLPPLAACGDSVIRVISSGPGQYYQAAEKSFFIAVTNARKSVWIMTPYFVPDRPFVKALEMAEARGVDIRIIVPKENNHWYVKMASLSLYQNLLESGVRVFETEGAFSHAKAMLVDGEWIYMGSSNCDVRSFRLNYELDFAVAKGEFIALLHHKFIESMDRSKEVSLIQVIRKSLFRRLAENLCSLLIPVL